MQEDCPVALCVCVSGFARSTTVRCHRASCILSADCAVCKVLWKHSTYTKRNVYVSVTYRTLGTSWYQDPLSPLRQTAVEPTIQTNRGTMCELLNMAPYGDKVIIMMFYFISTLHRTFKNYLRTFVIGHTSKIFSLWNEQEWIKNNSLVAITLRSYTVALK